MFASDVAYLIGYAANPMLLTTLGIILLFSVSLAVRDGVARAAAAHER